MVANNWSRFVLIVWLFMADYTAKLSSIFTVDQLDFASSEDCYIGHQLGSGAKDFLIKELKSVKRKSYTRFEEYRDAMNLVGKKGGDDAVLGEIPYMKLFLSRYGSEYGIVRQTLSIEDVPASQGEGMSLVPAGSSEVKLSDGSSIDDASSGTTGFYQSKPSSSDSSARI